MTSGSSGGTRFVVLVRGEEEAGAARAAGAIPARSLDDPALAEALGPFRRIEAEALPALDERPFASGETLLLDTTPGRLFDRFTFPEIAERAARTAERGSRSGYAGGLEAPDVPRLLPLRPAFLVFDRAVRDEVGALDVHALADLAALFAEPDPPAAFDGTPDKVFVRDLVAEMELGAYASERGRRQRVRFSVEAELAPHVGRRTAANVYSYDRIMDAARSLAARTPEPFVETLAEALAEELLDDARLVAVTVRVEKLDLGPSAAGVEIRRTRQR